MTKITILSQKLQSYNKSYNIITFAIRLQLLFIRLIANLRKTYYHEIIKEKK